MCRVVNCALVEVDVLYSVFIKNAFLKNNIATI